MGRGKAEILAAEIGLNVSRFPRASHLASWAGMSPEKYEGAGKRKNGPMRLGNRASRRALPEAAHGAARATKSDQGYLHGRYGRLNVSCGAKEAAVVVVHTIQRIVYHILNEREAYRGLVIVAHGQNGARSSNRRHSATRCQSRRWRPPPGGGIHSRRGSTP